MVKFTLYVEGGSHIELDQRFRQAFKEFFLKAGFSGHLPRVVMCGTRRFAYDKFCAAFKALKSDEVPVLLVDSETSFGNNISKWNFLKNRQDDQWDKPTSANEDSVFLLVQCMESWFLADREMLKRFYGQNFNVNALPGNQNIEEIDKVEVYKALDNATRNTQKQKYDKGKHSPELLKLLNPSLVISVSPHANQLIERLNSQ